MRRRSIPAARLLYGFVLDADSFLPNLKRFLDSPLYRLRLFYRRSDGFCTNRTAADSAAAGLILSHTPARREARARCARSRSRGFTKISTGENHEISAFDCSTNYADGRDLDLIERSRLLRWRSLLPRRLLHDNDPIIRAV